MSSKQSKTFLDITREELAIDKIVINGHDAVMKYLQRPYEELGRLTAIELAEAMHIISRYCLHLRVVMGQAKAKLSAMESTFNYNINSEAKEYKMASSQEERKAIALRNSDDLQDLHSEILKQKMIIGQLEPIIWGIDNHCNRLETIIKNREEFSGGI